MLEFIYKEFMESIAKDAGIIIKNNFLNHGTTKYKSNDSPVTDTDININKILINKIKEKFPEHGIIGEEESSYHQAHDYVWVVDPLDGTIAFIAGLPISTFSLALTHKGKPIAGVVYDPYMDRMYYAEKGKGTYLNNKKIEVNNFTEKSKQIVAVEDWNAAPYKIQLYNIFNSQNIKTFVLCSIILPCCLVASGQLTGAAFPGNTCWDMAAVKIIVEEAGGKVTDLYGNEQDYNKPIKGAIVSNNILHKEYLNQIKQHLD